MKYATLSALLGLTSLAITLPAADAPAEPPHLAIPAELNGLKLSGTMKQIIGTFGTYGHPEVGDTFVLDFTQLPQRKLDLVRPNFDPNRDVTPYIPHQAPLRLTTFDRGEPHVGGTLIVLTAQTPHAKLVVQLRTRELKVGEPVRIYFLEQHDDWIGCMAEAEGVLK